MNGFLHLSDNKNGLEVLQVTPPRLHPWFCSQHPAVICIAVLIIRTRPGIHFIIVLKRKTKRTIEIQALIFLGKGALPWIWNKEWDSQKVEASSPPPSKLRTTKGSFKKQISRGDSLSVHWSLGQGSLIALNFTPGITFLKFVSRKNLEAWKDVFKHKQVHHCILYKSQRIRTVLEIQQ